jgi:hypothetical protein
MMQDSTRNIRRVLKSPSDRKRVLLVAGVVLMAISFLVYPAYPMIILWLPVSHSAKMGAIVTAWLLSWSVFTVGVLLAGLKGYEWLKKAWRRKGGGAKS